MPIIGMTLKKIEANRKKPITGEVKVNSTPEITGAKEVDVATLDKKAVDMSFDLTTKYEPEIAEIRISGSVLFLTDNTKEIMEQWKDKKRLPEKTSIEVLNYLFRHCLLKVANMADELQLPPPLQLPRVKEAKSG